MWAKSPHCWAQGTVLAATRDMATVLISAWVLASTTFCLAVLRGAARRRPRVYDPVLAESATLHQAGLNAIDSHVGAASHAAAVAAH
jgi:hypothetical protein